MIDDSLYALITFDDRMHVITDEQCKTIVAAKNSGEVQTVSIGRDVIVLSQIRGIPTLATYRMQMKHRLALKNQKLCSRCARVMYISDRCSCRESGLPSFVAEAAATNPAIQILLGTTKSLPANTKLIEQDDQSDTLRTN